VFPNRFDSTQLGEGAFEEGQVRIDLQDWCAKHAGAHRWNERLRRTLRPGDQLSEFARGNLIGSFPKLQKDQVKAARDVASVRHQRSPTVKL
jgi:hypothetical protein